MKNNLTPILFFLIIQGWIPLSLTATPNQSDTTIERVLENRKKSLYFHNTLMQIQEPSLVSVWFMDYTKNLSGFQKKPFILDGDVQTPIAIGGKRFVGKHGKWLNAIHVTPQFRVRIFNDDPAFPAGPVGDRSLPVRTPSTMVGITYYGAPARFSDPEEFGNPTILDNLYFGLRGFHHSNGQDGYELDTLRPANKGKINIYNGNFGENLVFEFIVGGKTEFRRDNIMKSRSNLRVLEEKKQYKPGTEMYLKMHRQHEMYWRASYEWHPKPLTSQFFDSLSIYGRHRINLNLGQSVFVNLLEVIRGKTKWDTVMQEKKYEKWRVTGNMNFIFDGDLKAGNAQDLKKVSALDVSKRLNLWITCYRMILQTQNAAFFVQAGYFGSDNYNIYFAQRMWQLRFGLAFGIFDQPEPKDFIH